MSKKLDLVDDDGCFVCGKSNPIGLKLEFSREGDEYVTYFTPSKEHQGWQGIVHGGIVCTVMDEVMAGNAYELGHNAVTGSISLRYHKPCIIGRRIRFAGKIESIDGKVITTSATATDEDGELLVTGTGKIIKVDWHTVRKA